MRNERVYLEHIKESIADIRAFVSDGRDAFMSSKMAQAAVCFKLQTMAQSTLKLPDALKEKHPEVNWRAIRGFRNVVVHDYLKIELEEVWNIVLHDLTPLDQAVEKMLQELPNEDST